MNKLMQLLIMYHEIHRLRREGYKVFRIARKLGLDRRTVRKYLIMSEQEFLDHADYPKTRDKILDSYENYVRVRLEDCPEASAAQVHDWLKEHHKNFPAVNEKTVFNFVLWVRNKHGIPKPFNQRDYSQVEELPYGKQAQVDFGQYNMTTIEGKRKKVYFFSMVLSRARQKYVVFRDAPFNTVYVIDAHEKCFEFFQGIPEEIVYDQDTLMLVSENKGDLILTNQFRQYVQYRGFKLYFCRKSDPQTKGKTENVIKYIKYNFLRGRKYEDLFILNRQAIDWLYRTANAKVHAATRLVPQQQWLIEKQYLKPVGELLNIEPETISYNVRKDNTIIFSSNFYRVPVGTYKGEETTVNVKVTGEHLTIYDTDSKEIARHRIHMGKGKLIGSNNLKRDYSLKIDKLIDEVSGEFRQPDSAREYLQQIRKNNPRYIRDQLLLIKKLTQTYGMDIMNPALDFCVENKILKATDMEHMAKRMHAEKGNNQESNMDIKMVKSLSKSVFKIIPEKSNISVYKSLMT